MEDVCRICLETKDKLDSNVLDYVDTIENLVGVEVIFDLFPLVQQFNHLCSYSLIEIRVFHRRFVTIVVKNSLL